MGQNSLAGRVPDCISSMTILQFLMLGWMLSACTIHILTSAKDLRSRQATEGLMLFLLKQRTTLVGRNMSRRTFCPKQPCCEPLFSSKRHCLLEIHFSGAVRKMLHIEGPMLEYVDFDDQINPAKSQIEYFSVYHWHCHEEEGEVGCKSKQILDQLALFPGWHWVRSSAKLSVTR